MVKKIKWEANNQGKLVILPMIYKSQGKGNKSQFLIVDWIYM